MNSSRCSKLAAVIVVVVLAAAVPAGAVSVSGDTPTAVEVSESQTLTYEVTDLYTDYNQWTLHGETQLTDVSWTVTLYDQTGAQITRETYNGQRFDRTINSENDVNRVGVRLEGSVTAVDSYSYDPAQSTTLATFTQVQEGGTSSDLEAFTARPYTADSQAARDAIDDAESAVEDAQSAGVGVSDAEDDLQDAIEFYNSGNFEQATENANEAEQTANSAASSAQQTDLLMMVGGGLVVLLVVLGSVYWYLQQRETHDKLG